MTNDNGEIDIHNGKLKRSRGKRVMRETKQWVPGEGSSALCII